MAKDLGDFQTPPPLVEKVLARITASGKVWERVLEPTCGRGNFIRGLLDLAIPPAEIIGIEVQERHFLTAQDIAFKSENSHVSITRGNLFEIDLRRDLSWRTQGALLIVGNPPWVTNADLGVLESTNLPRKSNLKSLKGLDAQTGGANFDIAEFICLKLIRELDSEHPTIALLCKTSVARNVLQFAANARLPITNSYLCKIDAKRWFNAAVDACLFYLELGPEEAGYRYETPIYSDLNATIPDTIMSVKDGQLIADLEAYHKFAAIDGVCSLTWRQGLKHDAASIMELSADVVGRWYNKLGEILNIEPDYIYPLLKSSDLFNDRETSQNKKAVIVTQKYLGEDTSRLEKLAPDLWRYLTDHADRFVHRKSSIYEGKPPFSIFGIGDYAFALYKVAISGLHKEPRFRAIGPVNERPVMLDDTCYFIDCSSAQQAALLTSLLNNPLCLNFLRATTFLDAKRPVTKKLLQRINLTTLLRGVEMDTLILKANMELEQLGVFNAQWPSSLERFLAPASSQAVNLKLFRD